jgi:hypothetical protein
MRYLIIAILALTACGIDQMAAEPDAQPSPDIIEQAACRLSDPCEDGEACDWYGADPDQCVTASAHCHDGVCAQSHYDCETDEDCPDAVLCRYGAGVCQPAGADCRVDADCAWAQEYCSVDPDGLGSCVACPNSADDENCDCGSEPLERNGCLDCGC